MARLYSFRSERKPHVVASSTYPGFTLSEIIDQFLAEGVVPDFLPADLGEDLVEEFDQDGYPIVDPAGNIRVSRLDAMEAALFEGLPDPDISSTSQSSSTSESSSTSDSSSMSSTDSSSDSSTE